MEESFRLEGIEANVKFETMACGIKQNRCLPTYLNQKLFCYLIAHWTVHLMSAISFLTCHTNGLSTIQVPLKGKRVVYCCFVNLLSMAIMALPFIV